MMSVYSSARGSARGKFVFSCLECGERGEGLTSGRLVVGSSCGTRQTVVKLAGLAGNVTLTQVGTWRSETITTNK